MNSSFWKSKKVFVTGADGFIGSHLTEKLIELGAKVTILVEVDPSDGTKCYSLKNISIETAKKIDKVVCCDIASMDTTEFVVKANPQIILHLAASAYVPFSFEHPLEVFAVNVQVR